MALSLEERFPILDRLQDSFDPISEADLRALEADLGVTLPADYVEFLLTYNAAYMQHPVEFRVRNPGPFVEGGTFDCSFGIVKEWPESETGSNIRWHAETFDGRIPSGLVPIAHSATDPICMALSAEDHGRIYLWDSIDEGADDNTYLVADSFTEFLACLYPGDESYTYVEELPIFQAVERGQLASVHEYLSEGGKADCRNAQGQTLLMCAARTAWPKIVRLLLDRGAQPSARDADDRTPVYHAAMGQSNDSLKLLFAAGADSRWCDERGRTLVKLAEKRGYYQVTRLLEKQLSAPSTGKVLATARGGADKHRSQQHDFYLRADVTNRGESAERYAARLLKFVNELAPDDTAGAVWHVLGENNEQSLRKRAVVGDREYLVNLFSDSESAACDFGLQIELVTTDVASQTIELRISGGTQANKEGGAVVIKFPHDLGTLAHHERMSAILAAVARAWEPTWAAVLSRQATATRPYDPGKPFVDWMIYLSRNLLHDGTTIHWPGRVEALRGNLGAIIVAQDEPPDPNNQDHSRNVERVRQALGL